MISDCWAADAWDVSAWAVNAWGLEMLVLLTAAPCCPVVSESRPDNLPDGCR